MYHATDYQIWHWSNKNGTVEAAKVTVLVKVTSHRRKKQFIFLNDDVKEAIKGKRDAYKMLSKVSDAKMRLYNEKKSCKEILSISLTHSSRALI